MHLAMGGAMKAEWNQLHAHAQFTPDDERGRLAVAGEIDVVVMIFLPCSYLFSPNKINECGGEKKKD